MKTQRLAESTVSQDWPFSVAAEKIEIHLISFKLCENNSQKKEHSAR
jgi:hypothetical protein